MKSVRNHVGLRVLRNYKSSERVEHKAEPGDVELADITFVFFFQAEDGIRDWSVTGVQTCALPISLEPSVSKQKNNGITHF